ncbi:MAG: LamG domain-containing protein, partial [Planctomycetes bacterium]|nr:LamG domain-containing protein [Planctomycetota bacterium]
ATVIDNTWHHIAYVIDDSANVITVYVDGSEALSFTSAVSIAATDILSLGQEYDAGLTTGDFYSGQLDDVRVYNWALSEAEIAILAQ